MLNLYCPFFSLIYKYILGFACPLAWENFAFGELQNAWFHVFLKSKLISTYDFFGGVALKIGKAIISWFFCPLMREILHAWRDFFSLMWEILHACRDSGRNSVQAGDSLSMRESWKPCIHVGWGSFVTCMHSVASSYVGPGCGNYLCKK